ncbi:sigma factor-like helix-turn-helix DNA-binding protein [uncultured Cetobacterium sp.]|uniref:sigma factor-like helix-turn-helix DNA-binding protein n=1 Tax=uncultured Cetobacterium sp. TaxID=527638 RepID=UPI00260B0E67|nr:sigma factor-like helix-turn-helix DNA-binding protein [uncultured Cetobacterium sp.]
MSTYNLWSNYLRIDRFINSDEKKLKFLNFCSDENIKYLSEINEELLIKYSSIPGVGPGRISDIKNDLIEIKERLLNQKNYQIIMDCRLDKIIFHIKNIENITVGRFLSYSKDEIDNLHLSINDLEKIYEICTTTLPLNETLKKINLTLSPEDIKLLIDRLEKNKTLEEIGSQRNISRERTRQIEIKLKQIVASIFKNTNLNVALKIQSDFKDEISLEEMIGLFGHEHLYLVSFLKKNEIFSRPFYIDFLDLFLFDRRERFFKIFYSLEFTNILTTENVKTIRTSFKSFKWVEQDEIEKIISKLGYEKHGKYYVQNSGYKDILELYFVKLVLHPLRVDENTIKIIVQDINTKLEYNLYSDELTNTSESSSIYLARRLEGLLSRIDGIIMTDSRTYIHINKIKYNVEAFIKLKDTILSFNDNYIDSIAVYKNLEKELNIIGIYSDHVFYSLFKYHFAQELNLTTNGNSRVLTIGDQEFNRVEELEKFIETEGKILEKNYIQEKLNYSNVSLNNAIDNSNEIISFDRSFIGLIDFVSITKNESELFKKLVLNNDDDGNILIPELISKINLHKGFKEFIKKNSINKYFIASLVRYHFPEYKGGCNLLSKKNNSK